MKSLIPIFFSIIVISLLIILFCLVFVDGESLSQFVGFDITKCQYIGGENVTYHFSLVEAKPFLLVGLVILTLLAIHPILKVDWYGLNLGKIACWVGSYFRDSAKLVIQSNLKYFLAIILIGLIYFAYSQPVTFDEVWTYNLFLKRPIWECMMLYPIPNNHILYSILGNVTENFSFIDLLLRIRIPSFCISLLTSIIIYRFVRKFYSEKVALVCVVLTAALPLSIMFGFLARGYGMISMFTILCLYAAFNIVKGENRKRDWAIFALSGILGAYAMPSFLYPFVTINLYILICNYKCLSRLVVTNLLVGAFVYLLYLPIIVVCGLKSLVGNEFVTPISRLEVIKSLPGFMMGTIESLFTVSPYLMVLIFVGLFIYTIWKKDKETVVLWLLFGSMPFLLLTAHSVLPYFRTFSYYGFVFVFISVISLRNYIDVIHKNIIAIAGIGIILLGFFNFNYHSARLLDTLSGYKAIGEMVEDKKRYCIESGSGLGLFYQNFIFEAERHKYQIDVEMHYEGDDADLIDGFDYYLIEEDRDNTKNTQPAFSFNGVKMKKVNVYKYNKR